MIMLLDKRPIKAFTVAEIKGKKVVTREAGSTGAAFNDLALRTIGIDPKKDV